MFNKCRIFAPIPRNNLIEKHAALSISPSKAPPNPLENMTKIATSVAPAEKIEAPMCVNIVRLQDYLLPPDEVVLFDWLLVKQCYVFHHKKFLLFATPRGERNPHRSPPLRNYRAEI